MQTTPNKINKREPDRATGQRRGCPKLTKGEAARILLPCSPPDAKVKQKSKPAPSRARTYIYAANAAPTRH